MTRHSPRFWPCPGSAGAFLTFPVPAIRPSALRFDHSLLDCLSAAGETVQLSPEGAFPAVTIFMNGSSSSVLFIQCLTLPSFLSSLALACHGYGHGVLPTVLVKNREWTTTCEKGRWSPTRLLSVATCSVTTDAGAHRRRRRQEQKRRFEAPDFGGFRRFRPA